MEPNGRASSFHCAALPVSGQKSAGFCPRAFASAASFSHFTEFSAQLSLPWRAFGLQEQCLPTPFSLFTWLFTMASHVLALFLFAMWGTNNTCLNTIVDI